MNHKHMFKTDADQAAERAAKEGAAKLVKIQVITSAIRGRTLAKSQKPAGGRVWGGKQVGWK